MEPTNGLLKLLCQVRTEYGYVVCWDLRWNPAGLGNVSIYDPLDPSAEGPLFPTVGIIGKVVAGSGKQYASPVQVPENWEFPLRMITRTSLPRPPPPVPTLAVQR